MTYRYQDLSEYDWLMEEILRHETPQALALGALLHDRLQPKSVLDVGCGPGIYLVPFKERGSRVYGVDGAPAAGGVLDPSEFELVDLRNGWTAPYKFDLALCIEVGEHLRPEFAEGLVRLLAEASDTIYFSAARPNQGGEGHYNEQPQAYWKDLFSRFGLREHPKDGEVRQAVNAGPEYEHCHWLRWNGMLLGR